VDFTLKILFLIIQNTLKVAKYYLQTPFENYDKNGCCCAGMEAREFIF
jgi:hypothetical protein